MDKGEEIQSKALPTQKSLFKTSRWVAIIVTLLTGALFAALPAYVTFGPGWVPLALEGIVLLLLLVISLGKGPISHKTARIFAFILLGIITCALISGVILLITTIPARKTEKQAGSLLYTGALLWICNVLVFTLWYWEIDGGGPLKRHQSGHKAADFLFPQQVDGNTTGWVPHLVDYIFLAFTGATALSPTDTYPLTRPAKILMMIEAVIALIVLAVLIGRAVNIL